MGINIGKTNEDGHYIGNSEIFQSDDLKLYLNPYDFASMGNDGGSTIYDLSAGEYDFTLANDAQNRTDGHWSFDGTNDFAYRADDTSENFDFGTTTDFSIQMWYRNLGSGDWWLWSKMSYPGELKSHGLGFDDSESKLVYFCGYNNYYGAASAAAGWDSGWVNVALVVDRSTDVKFYKNGELVTTDSGATTSANLSNAYAVAVGGYAPTGSPPDVITGDYEGYIGPIWVYRDHLLTADQVKQNFNVHRGMYGV